MHRLWLCRNCESDPHPETGLTTSGHKFDADAPVCPKCGLDRRKPDERGHILPVEVIHFDPPHPVIRDRGERKAACDGTPVGSANKKPVSENLTVMATGSRGAVTCPACKETEAFKSDREHGAVIRKD